MIPETGGAVTLTRVERLARAAAVLALVALALMVWSIVQPTPLTIVVAMTAGQAIGTASLALLLAAIVVDLRTAKGVSHMPALTDRERRSVAKRDDTTSSTGATV